MKIKLAILLFLTHFQSSAQNLVPNPSFEDFTSCPSNNGQVDSLLFWYKPTAGSSDFFHSCYSGATNVGTPLNYLGTQTPLNGEGYVGIITAYELGIPPMREYVQVELNQALINNITYTVSFSVSLADSSNYATDDIGLYLSIDSLTNFFQSTNLNVIPQIENLQGNILSNTGTWYNISGQYTAQGGEKFITIGNFKDDLNTTNSLVYVGSSNPTNYLGYYFIDEICISQNPNDCTSSVGIQQFQLNDKFLVKIIDASGRETEEKPNTLLIYVYSDGTTEKVFKVE